MLGGKAEVVKIRLSIVYIINNLIHHIIIFNGTRCKYLPVIGSQVCFAGDQISDGTLAYFSGSYIAG